MRWDLCVACRRERRLNQHLMCNLRVPTCSTANARILYRAYTHWWMYVCLVHASKAGQCIINDCPCRGDVAASGREKNWAALLIHLRPANQPAQGTDNDWLCQRLTLLHYDGAQCGNHTLEHTKEEWLYKYMLCVDALKGRCHSEQWLAFYFILFNLQEHVWKIGDPKPF